jgi:anti-anti-sigma factor
MTIGAAPSRSVLHIFRLGGEIDMANAERVGTEILELVEEDGCDAVLVDCRSLTFLDASGLSMMLRAQRHADAVGVTLAWSRLSGLHLRALELVALADHLRIVE